MAIVNSVQLSKLNVARCTHLREKSNKTKFVADFWSVTSA